MAISVKELDRIDRETPSMRAAFRVGKGFPHAEKGETVLLHSRFPSNVFYVHAGESRNWYMHSIPLKHLTFVGYTSLKEWLDQGLKNSP